MDEVQVAAFWQHHAAEYNEDTNPHNVADALQAIAAQQPELYRGAVKSAAAAVGRISCPHGDTAPGELPNISNLAEKAAAAKQHAGLCGKHHAKHIAGVSYAAVEERFGEAASMKNLRNQVGAGVCWWCEAAAAAAV